MAFGAKLEQKKLAQPSEKPYRIPENNRGDTLSELEGAFGAHIKDYQVDKNRLGNVMRIEMSVEEFETVLRDIDVMRSGEEVTTPESFVPTLISLIDTSQTRIPYRMDMFVHTPSAIEELQKSALIKQVARFGRALEIAGMPRKLISAGLKSGDDDRMTLVFRRYDPVVISIPEEDVVDPAEALQPEEQVAL